MGYKKISFTPIILGAAIVIVAGLTTYMSVDALNMTHEPTITVSYDDLDLITTLDYTDNIAILKDNEPVDFTTYDWKNYASDDMDDDLDLEMDDDFDDDFDDELDDDFDDDFDNELDDDFDGDSGHIEDTPVYIEEVTTPEPVSNSSSSYDSSEYIFHDSNSRYLSETEVRALSAANKRLARNEIYARHGRKFSSSDLQTYFNSKSWYTALYSPSDFDAKQNSFFNDYESKNIALITRLE